MENSTSELVDGFILTRSHSDEHGSLSINLWVKTDTGAVYISIPRQFSIFFIETTDLPSIKNLNGATPQKTRNLALRSTARKPVSALYFANHSTARKASRILRELGIACFEDDIRPTDRYLMERHIKGAVRARGTFVEQHPYPIFLADSATATEFIPEFRTLSLDIECSRHGELYCIGLYCESENYKKVLMVGSGAEGWIDWAESEKTLLQRFVEELNRFDPDIIIGWNVIDFDFRLLLERASLHDIALAIARDGSCPELSKREPGRQTKIKIPGRVVIDGIIALRAATYSFPSFSLDNVAQTLLGRRKEISSVTERLETIESYFLNDKLALANYNIVDCLLVAEIFKKTKLLAFLVYRSKLTGVELDRGPSSIAAFTNLYLPKMHRAGYVSGDVLDPNSTSPGGYVLDSRPGIFKNIVVLDFKSLYPSIIRTFLIDPIGMIEADDTPHDVVAGFDGAKFSRSRHILPGLIAELSLEREKAKQAADSARSQAIKILMNSFYGILAAPSCRFFDNKLACSITKRGHQILKQTAAWTEEFGYAVIYGDTDSIFVQFPPEQDSRQCIQQAETLCEKINQRWASVLRDSHFLESHLTLQYDILYRRFFMPTMRAYDEGSKKRYAGMGVVEEHGNLVDKLIFKGLENVRTDWTELAKNFQHQLYECIFYDQDPVPLIEKQLDEILSGALDSALIYTRRIRKPLENYTKTTPPHVRAARLKELRQGERKDKLSQENSHIQYVMTRNGPEPIDNLTAPIDYQHYIDKQIKPIAETILRHIDVKTSFLFDKQLDLFH
ncbi:DNA polymerase II [Chitinimonas lacunae]|uniref:DNA polymerase n=1 Tax=Chitinimonas lacunae TaxID=1963018 RepID=A0ABV8MRN2_9NEIS